MKGIGKVIEGEVRKVLAHAPETSKRGCMRELRLRRLF